MTAADVLKIAKRAGACELGLVYFDEFRAHTRKDLRHSSAASFWLWLAKYDEPGCDRYGNDKMYTYRMDMRWCLSNMLVWRGMREGEIAQLVNDILGTKRKRREIWASDGYFMAIWRMTNEEARAICRALARAYSE